MARKKRPKRPNRARIQYKKKPPPQQATGYQKEVNSKLSEVTKQASGKHTLRYRKFNIKTLISIFSLFISIYALLQSKSANDFSAINSEANWYNIVKQYEETDTILREWEKSKGLKHENSNRSVTESKEGLERDIAELEKELIKLNKGNIPSNIKESYKIRFWQYQSLKHTSELYKPFADRFSTIDFTLPSPPKIPSGGFSHPGFDRPGFD